MVMEKSNKTVPSTIDYSLEKAIPYIWKIKQLINLSGF